MTLELTTGRPDVAGAIPGEPYNGGLLHLLEVCPGDLLPASSEQRPCLTSGSLLAIVIERPFQVYSKARPEDDLIAPPHVAASAHVGVNLQVVLLAFDPTLAKAGLSLFTTTERRFQAPTGSVSGDRVDRRAWDRSLARGGWTRVGGRVVTVVAIAAVGHCERADRDDGRCHTNPTSDGELRRKRPRWLRRSRYHLWKRASSPCGVEDYGLDAVRGGSPDPGPAGYSASRGSGAHQACDGGAGKPAGTESAAGDLLELFQEDSSVRRSLIRILTQRASQQVRDVGPVVVEAGCRFLCVRSCHCECVARRERRAACQQGEQHRRR